MMETKASAKMPEECFIIVSFSFQQCFDPEKAFFQKMYLIVMNQGKSRDKLRDDLYKKKLIYFNSVTRNVKESTETS